MPSHRKFDITWRIFYEVIILRFENLLQSAMSGLGSLGTDKKHADVVMYTIWNPVERALLKSFQQQRAKTRTDNKSLIQQDILVYERTHGK
jgi:hypothetical protein